MIPILEKMLPVAEEMKTYYKNKQYLQDNYAKSTNIAYRITCFTR